MTSSSFHSSLIRPRLGFLGAGWIGRHRLEAVASSGLATIAAIADPSDAALDAIRPLAPDARAGRTLDDLIARDPVDLDGIVIATPSAMHAEQSIRCLRRGLAVFCQKPLGRTADETALIVQTARRVDRLLGVDFSYRFTAGLQRLRELVIAGTLGTIFGIDLVFHNAYGPDKPWFYDARLSGGGCVIDLGIHLVDLVRWTLDDRVVSIDSRLYCGGRPIVLQHDDRDGPATPMDRPVDRPRDEARENAIPVEDYAVARLEFSGGATANLACSWKLPLGRDCEIGAAFYGTRGGAAFHNVDGSFDDFATDHFEGARTTRLVSPPDDWGGRAILDWTARLAANPHFDAEIEQAFDVARVIDGIYHPQTTRIEPSVVLG